MGIEPTSQPWQGRVLPLNHARIIAFLPYISILAKKTGFFQYGSLNFIESKP